MGMSPRGEKCRALLGITDPTKSKERESHDGAKLSSPSPSLPSAFTLPLTAHARHHRRTSSSPAMAKPSPSPSLPQGSPPSIYTSITSPRAVPEQLTERLAPQGPHFYVQYFEIVPQSSRPDHQLQPRSQTSLICMASICLHPYQASRLGLPHHLNEPPHACSCGVATSWRKIDASTLTPSVRLQPDEVKSPSDRPQSSSPRSLRSLRATRPAGIIASTWSAFMLREECQARPSASGSGAACS